MIYNYNYKSVVKDKNKDIEKRNEKNGKEKDYCFVRW